MKKGIDLMEAKNSTWGKALSILIAVVMAISVFTPISLAFAAEQAAAAFESQTCPNASDGKHNYTGENKVNIPPTCEAPGYSEAKTCKYCGAIDPNHSGTSPKLGHDYGEWVVEEPATCTEKGVEKHTCNRCGHTESQEIEALDHDYYYDTIEPVCGIHGSITTKCSRCDYETIEILNAFEHDYGEWKTIKEATCTEEGIEQRVCAHNESHIEKRFIKTKSHNLCDDAEKPATCTETGLTKGSHCSVCNKVIELQKEVDALGHNFDGVEWNDKCKSHENADCTTHTKLCKTCDGKLDGGVQIEDHKYPTDWTIERQATIDEAGVMYRVCVDCSHKITQEIPKLGVVSVNVQFVDEDGNVVKSEDPIQVVSGKKYDVSDLVDSIPEGYEANGAPYGDDVTGVADTNKTINVPVKKIVVEQPDTPTPVPGPTEPTPGPTDPTPDPVNPTPGPANPAPGTPSPVPTPAQESNLINPVVTPFIPVVAPAAAPAAAPAVAPAAAPAAVDEATIEDEENPLAETPEEQVIADDENALAGFDDPHCWTHWLMIIGATTTIIYCVCVIARRRNSIKQLDDFEKEVLGIGERRTAAAAQRGVVYNAYQSMQIKQKYLN